MYTVFLAGGIASGKSTVARMLERRGAWRIDLDQVSRDVCAPGSDVLPALAAEFGADVVDADTGALDRPLLALRAFASPEATAALEAIELPAISEALSAMLTESSCAAKAPALAVVEVPLLDRAAALLPLADEVVAVECPLGLRRERAVGRGMDAADFDRRTLRQPTDEYLAEHADWVFVNDGDERTLERQVDEWWSMREQAGWTVAPTLPGGLDG
ncbi:MAG: dephospho-CoA kinase [Atopobiaceae bacterium]|jgi:dephospho-CoA kinase|nr:dephospho-CoA kinase [Atopobiaceae bacterium]